MIVSGVEPGDLREFDTPAQASRDMKSLQALLDQTRRLEHVITVNIETIDALSSTINGMQTSDPDSRYVGFVQTLSNVRRRQFLSRKALVSLTQRAESLSRQVNLLSNGGLNISRIP